MQNLEIEVELALKSNIKKIIVKLINGKVFGSQPYLAIKTKEGRYYHDNFNEGSDKRTWEYLLDESSIPFELIDKISVASNDIYGNQSIKSFAL